LVRLTVESFQCIERAELDFGPGLNVLFGPNDLGKSSLAWAIRAVLLLQHSSSAHERFVSWYGGGVPRVALTLADDDDRYWRVTKAFAAGTSGSSLLEISKDGKEPFIRDTMGRAVDEKIRGLLRWGVPLPGGKSTLRGFSESFLTQVLLADQDDVHKTLFASSLTSDPDASGRLRLTEALGALAQDPLFKKVLDEAQACTDQAFTPTGKKKRDKGSPFIDIASRLKELEGQRGDLTDKVRETELAVAKIKVCQARRDEDFLNLDEARQRLAEALRLQAAHDLRSTIQAQLNSHREMISGAENLKRDFDQAQDQETSLRTALDEATEQIRALGAEVKQDEIEREQALRALDALNREDTDFNRRSRYLEEEQKTAQDALHEAERVFERAAEDLRNAWTAAEEVAKTTASNEVAASDLSAAEAEASSAMTEESRCEFAFQEAQKRLRDATSGDAAQAREIRAKDLENRRLTVSAQRTEVEHALATAREIGRVVRGAEAAQAARDHQAEEVTSARNALELAEKSIAELDATRAALSRLERYGQLRQTREMVATAERAAAATGAEREKAARLREEGATLRTKARTDLPSAAEIEVFRRLGEDIRVAEARLGGGLTVLLRPARDLTVRATRDGAPDGARQIEKPTALSAERSLTLAIEDLIEIDITAGEEAARNEAAALGERWYREVASTLDRLRIRTVEELGTLRRGADDLLLQAEERERDAAQAEERATQQTLIDITPLREQIAALEADLRGVAQDELETELAALGERWQTSLRERLTDLARQRDDTQRGLEQERGRLTRAETQLEGLGREAAAQLQQATSRQEELPAPWSNLETQNESDLAVLERELLDIGERQALFASANTLEEDSARSTALEAEAALSAARSQREEAQRRVQAARDRAVSEKTKLEAAVAQARRLDTGRRWEEALRIPAPSLSTAAWQDDLRRAESLREEKKRAHFQVGEHLEDLKRERVDAIEHARSLHQQIEDRLRASRALLEERQNAEADIRTKLTAAQERLTEARVQLASMKVDQVRVKAEALQKELIEVEGEIGSQSGGNVGEAQSTVDRLSAELRHAEEELAKARGGLEQVGGPIVRERHDELDKAIEQTKERWREIEVEYDAWKLLADTLKSVESAAGAHLGRALAGPVSERFQELTGGRYGRLELGPHLETKGLHVANEIRDVGALSAGTQDQLATLLRLCIAEQLRSAIVLDDHLTHGDPARIDWFNDILRSSARQLQIVLITCRPAELLRPEELPADGETTYTTASGGVYAVDLARVIQRF
jgi:DNA repair exonuclease SbcCD ATPase subunit